MRKRTIRLISISITLVLTFLIASSGTFAASKPVLRKGMSGSAVKTLQLNLKKLGFFTASATGYFGDITVAAVKKFQRKYKIPATGVVATLTHSKLDSLLKPKPKPVPQKPKPNGLQVGNSGDLVTQLQSDLAVLGYMKVEPTGEFGPLTENALMQFQKKYGIEQHGVADTVTLEMIRRLLEQDEVSSRGGGERKSSVQVEISPMYEVKKEWVNAVPQIPYIDGVRKYQGVVFHYTDNPGDNARIEANYVKDNWQNAFVHEFIDANEIIQVADPDYKAWGAGKYANDKFIHLELCDARTQREFDISYSKIIRRTAEYLYMNQLGVSPARADGTGTLWAHIDVSRYLGGTNHSDPIDYLAKWGKKWSDVIDDVTEQYIAIASTGSPEKIIPEEIMAEGIIP
ncbi:MAG: hypothetical protein GX279_10725 [Clostridiaceae bacterium]|jgi:peptidoglycan hydrolase-like protein with peptidoglycan-binding domain|nr:hypothetical protein [Clostridiaceae bacterium]